MTLTARGLNRALLARQLLLERVRLPIARALERVGGLQAQYAPSPYIRLWSMLDGFALHDLTRALERRRAVQGTLMRSTIHVVSQRNYLCSAAGIGPSRQEWWRSTWGRDHGDVDLDAITHGLPPLGDGHRLSLDSAIQPGTQALTGLAHATSTVGAHVLLADTRQERHGSRAH